MAILGGAGYATLIGPAPQFNAQAASSCIAVAEQQTEGPYWVDEKLNRSDIRQDPGTGAIPAGLPLSLSINVHEINGAVCGPLPGAQVDVWHCDAAGLYSDVSANSTVGRKFLRGYQTTDDNGNVQFTTIYPGWYSGRTIHIHVRIRTFNGAQQLDQFTAQIFFDDNVTDQVFTQSPYKARRTRDTRNSNDMVLTGTRGATLFANLTKTSGGYSATADIGVNMKAATASKPAITAGGVVNAASFQAGVTPGAWLTIFGQNLASAAHALTSDDLVDGKLPTSLSGVSVKINNLPAYLSFVSPTQLNVQAPADTSLGSVPVTVTNSAGTSDVTNATLVAVFPGLFKIGNYAAAVRADGTVVSGSVAVKPGDILSLYGTGFGGTNPSIAPGTLIQTAVPLTNAVTVTIGGVTAPVSFSGLSAAGLNQINITVPAVGNGDLEVIAQVSGARTQSGALLKVLNS